MGFRGLKGGVLLLGLCFMLAGCGPREMPEAAPTPAKKPPVYLVHEGASPYQIVLDVDASPSEQQAAKELQTYFKACAGVEMPIVQGAAPEGTPMIVLGCGPVARSLGVDPPAGELGEQGYLMRTVSPHIVIAGTPEAGTLYGAYDFIEKQLGVRWYAPGVTKTPETKSFPLPMVDELARPPFAWRQTSYAWPGKDAEFLARVRDNSGSGGPDHPYGIQHNHDGRCHSYFWYVSPGEFFDTHPEYFSEIGGVRQSFETQLCLTNPDVLEIATERMLKRMADKPNCRQHNFSQMDYYNYCECEHCMAMNQKYGTAGGTQYWFVNQLAERTSKVYPDKLIGTLAYTYTEEPPKDLVMHPNVAVWLCHMFPSCDSHPIDTCELNADYKRRAIAWSKSCSHLYIWHYIVDFAHYYNPFPNFRAMAADMKFYRAIGVEGIYLQAMGSGGGGGEFSMLRPHYGMKLLWDPDQDPDALIRDFLEGYYGSASEPILEYITMLHDKVENDHIHMHLYTNPAMGYLTDEVMARAAVLFDKAEAAVAEDEELLERVKVARMPLTYARLFPRNGYTIEDGLLTFKGPFASLAETGEMYGRMQKHGFQTLREHSGDPNQLGMFAAFLSTPLEAPSIKNEHLEVDLVPFLGGRALRIIDRASGKCITAHNVKRCLYFPFAGGEETRFGGIYNPIGWYSQFTVTERSDNAITMSADVAGFKLRRTLSLEPGKPILNVTVELANTGDKPKEAQVRSHLELDLGGLSETRVRFSNRDGERIVRDMKPIIAGMREGEHYYYNRTPKGEWTFTGANGLEVTHRFDDAQIDFTWLYAYPDYLDELELEVWAKPVTLEAGETFIFSHEIEVQPAG